MSLVVDEFTDCERAIRNRTLLARLPGGEALIVLADGSDAAFSRGFQPVIDLVKKSLVESLNEGDGPFPERMRLAGDHVDAMMRRHFPTTNLDLDSPAFSATYLALVVADGRATAAWVGSQQVKLFRSGRCVAETAPHVVVLRTGDDRFAVTTRVVSTVPGIAGEPIGLSEAWELLPGDLLVMADFRLFANGSEEEVLAVVREGPTFAARALVEWAEQRRHDFAQSAVVIRIDGGSVSATASPGNRPFAVPFQAGCPIGPAPGC